MKNPGISDKKNFVFTVEVADKEVDIFDSVLSGYKKAFQVYRRNILGMAKSYVLGLMKCGKSHTNMERMAEEVDELNYCQYYHFLSESAWDYHAVNSQTSIGVSSLMQDCKKESGLPTGLIIDESSHLKKGTESVGVSRQYAGVVGKVDNCQVAVYGALSNGDNVSLVGTRLFLPECWTSDSDRCDKVGIPADERTFMTKPQLALSLIKELVSSGVSFDWIGGDGLYGHNTELAHGLDKEGLFYVLDVHKDELVYVRQPAIGIPDKKAGRGAAPIHPKADAEGTRIDTYHKSLKPSQWESVKVRKAAKGWKRVYIHKAEVWQWDGKEPQARRRTLIITRSQEKRPKVKYSLSNGESTGYSAKEYAYFQCSRYWVERAFDDAKNELGLSGYQVRKWLAWQHHQALVMMASRYLLAIKIKNREQYRILSIRDARIMLIAYYFTDQQTFDQLHKHMLVRHKNRQKDIDRYFDEMKQSKV